MNFDPDEKQQELSQKIKRLCESAAPALLPQDLEPQLERLGETGLFLENPPGGEVGRQCGLEELSRAEPRLAWAAGTGVIQAAALFQAFGITPLKGPRDALRQGKTIIPVAFSEPESGARPTRLGCRLEKDGRMLRVSGVKEPVSFFPGARSLLVAAEGNGGFFLCLLETDAPGVSLLAADTIAGLEPWQLARLTLDGVVLKRENVSAPLELGQLIEVRQEQQRRFACPFALGLARRALEAAISFCTAPRREGKPPAGYQLVRFSLAEMRTRLDAAEILCRRAAWAADSGSPEAGALFRCASVFALEAAGKISDQALEVCGRQALRPDAPFSRLLLQARQAAALGEPLFAERLAIADDVLSAVGT